MREQTKISYARARSTVAALEMLGATDADIKRALKLKPRDPVVWRWRTGKQGMAPATASALLEYFK